MSMGLFELRLKCREGIGRVFYCTLVDCKIAMLHQFVKKTEKDLRVRSFNEAFAALQGPAIMQG